MELEKRFLSPSSPPLSLNSRAPENIFRTSTQPEVPQPEDYSRFLSMSEKELFTFITVDLLEKENALYTKGNTAEHKLIFLVATNVATATLSNGEAVYTVPPSHPKSSEIAEFLAAVNDHYERVPNMPHILSEASDVFYNLLHLMKLDSRAKGIYEDVFENFMYSLGLSRLDVFRLISVKYQRRLFLQRKKDTIGEDAKIGLLLDSINGKSYVRTPTNKELSSAYEETEHMYKQLRSRLDQMQKNSRSKVERSKRNVPELKWDFVSG